MENLSEHIPMRTCIACRQSVPSYELERYVLLNQTLVYDLRHRAPGRGAYVHVKCLAQAHKRNGFSRAFKTKVPLPPWSELLLQVQEGIALRLREQLGTVTRARQVSLGGQELAEAMQQDQIKLVLFASDCGQSTRKKFEANAARKQIPTAQALDAQALGRLVGRDHIAVLGIRSDEFAHKIVSDLEKLHDLSVFEP